MKRTLVSLILGGFLTLPGWFPGGALQAEVLSGLDVLARDGFVPLKGKKVGIVTNCTGKDRKGNKIADLVFNAPGVTLAALFAPEHGLTGTEKQFLDSLRGKKTVWLVANKIDSLAMEQKVEKLEGIGFPYHEVSAVTGRSCGDLLEEVAKTLPDIKLPELTMPVIALVGRPNVGKSTLVNALTKTDRAVVSPVAGTTRDIVTAELTLDGKTYLLADTAGVRRRGQIEAGAEKFSVKRTMTAIAQSSAVLVLIDSTIGTTRGDLHLIYFAHQLKKPTLLVFNKIDLLKTDVTVQHKHTGKFDQVAISALNSEGVEDIADWIKKI